MLIEDLNSKIFDPKAILLEFRLKGVFYGEFYKTNSKIDDEKAKNKLFSQNGVFIMGYEITKQLFYEIWYKNDVGLYFVVDKFGSAISEGDDNLDASTNALFKFIGKEETIGGDIADFAVTEEEDGRKFNSKDEAAIRNLLKNKEVIKEFINQQVKEYYKTKLKESRFVRFWRNIIGTQVDLPEDITTSISGIKRVFHMVVGKKSTVTFIKGYTLNNKINLEIWYKKSKSTGKGSFEIIDLTVPSRPVQLSNGEIDSQSDAINEITRLLHVKVEDNMDRGFRREREHRRNRF